MDTKKVQELLRAIENGERKHAELEKAVKEAQNQLNAQEELTRDIKRQLADELRDVLRPTRRGARPGNEPGAQRSAGLSEAIMGALADGKPRTVTDLQRAVEEKGMRAANVAMSMGYLLKKGLVIRTGRGTYQKKS